VEGNLHRDPDLFSRDTVFPPIFSEKERRVGGGVTPTASHRSRRARLTHLARRPAALRALCYAIASCPHAGGAQCPRRVSRCRFRRAESPSLRRILPARVPRLPRYYETLRLLLLPLPGLIAFARRYRRRALAFAPPAEDAPPGGPGALGTVAPQTAIGYDGEGRSPRFLGAPGDGSLGSRTPVGPTRQALTACRRGPRLCQERRLPTREKNFEAPCPSFPSGGLRFVPAVARRHARPASGCQPALPGGVGYPQNPNERFPRCSHISSPFPRLRLAQ
jgi:hypothetical protein